MQNAGSYDDQIQLGQFASEGGQDAHRTLIPLAKAAADFTFAAWNSRN